MFLSGNKLYNRSSSDYIKKIQVSLRYSKSREEDYNEQNKILGKTIKSCRVRTFAETFGLRGVITIEAALCIWLFLSLMLSLVSVLQIWEAHQLIQRAVVDAGEECSVVGTESVGTAELYALALREFAKSDLEKYGIVGGIAGVSLIGSKVDDATGLMIVQATYRVRPAILFIPGLYLRMYNRIALRLWNGYKSGGVPGELADYGGAAHYYVSDYESVYHTDPSCTHLRLTIETIGAGNVAGAVNMDGHHYTACSKCDHILGSGIVYITPEGTKYHTSITCSGLKRTVHEVEHTGGLAACSRCGG